MLAALALLFASMFADSKAMAVQIFLDREGYSCSAIDGQWGKKSQQVLGRYLVDRGFVTNAAPIPGPNVAYDRYFSELPEPFRIEEVTRADLDALVKIPEDPAAKAKMPRMGYESIKEMFAERGHLSQRALTKLNPGVDWEHIEPGLKLVIPDFPAISNEIKGVRRPGVKRPVAALVKVKLSECLITALDAQGKTLAIFPCSIAANKAKVPASGELKIVSQIAWPNYTYTPDFVPAGKKVQRYVLPPGENSPVGVAWMGLNLPGYGIHGTPRPESIGFTGSHGCFRLANWNAARLFAMCRATTRVIIEP